jgi:hypothetical protein
VPSNAGGPPKLPLSNPQKTIFFDIEKRWLSLARSYEFTEWLSSFTAPFRKRANQ